jgi:regulator of sigma E protease
MNLGNLFLKLWDLVGYTILPFVIVLGIMIFVHEFGHYLAARLIGVRVLVFKLGFGRFIFSWKRGHTEYGVGWIPIGGYVRMFGDPTEVEDEDADTPLEEISEADKAEALMYKPAHQKLLTFFAGPLMNIALAFVISPFIYLLGIYDVPPVAGLLKPGSPAIAAGVMPGDRVLAIDGDPVKTLQDMKTKEALSAGKTLRYEIERNDQKLTIPIAIAPGEVEGLGESGIGPAAIPLIVQSVMPDSAAEKAGLQAGDTITGINGAPSSIWNSLSDAVKNGKGSPISLTLSRAGVERTVTLTPGYNEKEGRYLIGVVYRPVPLQTEFVHYGLTRSIKDGARISVGYVTLTFEILYKLLTFQISGKNMAGPLGIAAIISVEAHAGLADLIRLMVLITINLGILNLLPFPPLDGGHILFTAIEGVMRREIKMKYKEMTFRIGFILLIAVMLLVTFNDVVRYKGAMWEFFKEIGRNLGIG